MRLIDADWLEKRLSRWICGSGALDRFIDGIQMTLCDVLSAPTVNAVPVVHYKDTNTTVLNVKSIEDWQDRIILDEGEESRSSAVYYADSDDMVRVVRCKDCRFAFQNNGHDKEGCPIMDRRAWMNGNSFCSEGKPMDKKEATK